MKLVTKEELQEYLSIPDTTYRRWIKEGKLPPPMQPGGKYGKTYFDLDQVDAYLGRAITGNNTNKALN